MSAPRRGTPRLQGLYGDRIKVSLSAPPEDNRANAELVRVLASWLGLRGDSVRLRSGHGSRDKVVAFAGIGEAELRQKLNTLLKGDNAVKGEGQGGS